MDLVSLREYFEGLAADHKLVMHSTEQKRFVRTNPFEIENSITTTLNFPVVAMEDPFIPTDGNWSHVQDRWRGGIMVFDKVGDRGDFAAQETARDKCRKIAQDIKLRMINDRKKEGYAGEGWLKNLNLEAFTIEFLNDPLHEVLYGVRLSYEFSVWAGVHDSEVWESEDAHYQDEE